MQTAAKMGTSQSQKAQWTKPGEENTSAGASVTNINPSPAWGNPSSKTAHISPYLAHTEIFNPACLLHLCAKSHPPRRCPGALGPRERSDRSSVLQSTKACSVDYGPSHQWTHFIIGIIGRDVWASLNDFGAGMAKNTPEMESDTLQVMPNGATPGSLQYQTGATEIERLHFT